MKINVFIAVLLALLYTGCKQQKDVHDHDHETETEAAAAHDHDADADAEHNHDEDADHNHDEDHDDDAEHNHEAETTASQEEEHDHEAEAESAHDQEDVKLQLTAYSDHFEVFAEADPFVVGEEAHILAHFTKLPVFEALEEGVVSARLVINGKGVSQTLNHPTRKGIYSFELEPGTKGTGELLFDIKIEEESYQVLVPNITVYDDDHDAIHEAEEAEIHSSDGMVFTKEQSWRIDFATAEAKDKPFGEVIKASAKIEPSQGDEQIIVARTSGIVILSDDLLLSGKSVAKGEALLLISGSKMAENNSEVLYREAKNNYEKAEKDFERIEKLAKDKIVSEKELIEAENLYKNASVHFETLKKSFTASGQNIISPIAGYIKHMHISNGQYVEAGEALLSISKNETLLLEADVQQKYASVLDKIYDATIRTTHDGQSYTLEALEGKILAVGKAANDDNYMIPVHLQVNNTKHLVPGSFVEVYLKVRTAEKTVTVPTSSLLESQYNFSVIVQLTPELFEYRSVETGASDGISTEIVKGIDVGERIVSKGAILMKLAQSTGTLDAHSGHVH